MKKLAAGVSALALCASMTASAIGTALPAAAADTNNDDWLHAVGSRLYDSEGNEVWLTGANWFGLNCSENAPHGLYATEADPFLKAVADRGINVIRFPVSSELLISWMDGEPLEVSSVQCWGDETQGFNVEFLEADGKTTKNSLEIFEILLEKCKKYGLKCFIDVHSPHSDNSGHDWPLWYGKAGVTTESWIESLVWTADHFKNNDTVLGYDLENEPHGKGQDGENAAKWDGSTDENNWAYAATRCAEAILDVNPNALIFIEGVEQSLSGAMPGDYWGIGDRRDNSPYIGAWWGGNLRGVKDYPVVPKQGTSQIVYSPHDYGPVVYRQEWFKKNFTEETLLDDYWRDSWAYINEQDIAPLLIGEWGGKLPKGADLESYV
ncbi:MAG: glycoside hydrolase family 5 protein, partial [Oscillospiraceae bacterium]|nr:glycoside hydrolase family 5 protein [Oscillospiraceae bacterium]